MKFQRFCAALSLAVVMATVTMVAPAFVQPTPVVTTAPGIGIPPSGRPATATQNTITTTAPVSSETTISVGTLAGQLLNWVMLAFSGPIGGMVVWILVRLLKQLGINATDALRARLQEIVVNGLNAGARAVEQDVAGRGRVEIKNAVLANAVAYTQAHGADTIKALGLDPESGAAVEAIKARIETAIADPASPTPALLDPPKLDPKPFDPKSTGF